MRRLLVLTSDSQTSLSFPFFLPLPDSLVDHTIDMFSIKSRIFLFPPPRNSSYLMYLYSVILLCIHKITLCMSESSRTEQMRPKAGTSMKSFDGRPEIELLKDEFSTTDLPPYSTPQQMPIGKLRPATFETLSLYRCWSRRRNDNRHQYDGFSSTSDPVHCSSLYCCARLDIFRSTSVGGTDVRRKVIRSDRLASTNEKRKRSVRARTGSRFATADSAISYLNA